MQILQAATSPLLKQLVRFSLFEIGFSRAKPLYTTSNTLLAWLLCWSARHDSNCLTSSRLLGYLPNLLNIEIKHDQLSRVLILNVRMEVKCTARSGVDQFVFIMCLPAIGWDGFVLLQRIQIWAIKRSVSENYGILNQIGRRFCAISWPRMIMGDHDLLLFAWSVCWYESKKKF